VNRFGNDPAVDLDADPADEFTRQGARYRVPTSTDKSTKAEADYRPASLDTHVDRLQHAYARGWDVGMEIPVGQGVTAIARDNPDARCGTCSHFRSAGCSIVAGRIDPSFICEYWAERGGG
jgi:hypothetical protein